MFREGKPVPSTCPYEGLTNFLHWLSAIKKPVVLVAHNAKFDANVFCRSLLTHKLNEEAARTIQGFVDTLSLFRKSMPGLPSYKQQDLVTSITHTHYSAHDAESDDKALQQLVNSQKFTEDVLLEHSFSFDSYINVIQTHQKTQKNVASLTNLVSDKVVSKQIMTRIGKSGLSLSHLILAYKRDSDNGVFHLLSEKTNLGKPRVTANRKIIENLCAYLKNHV
jgi:DNA polymerase III alpha subunit (gram-positive type)